MSRIIVHLLCMNLLIGSVYSQERYVLSGVISDETSQPLPGAYVFLTPSGQGTVTDADGKYMIEHVGQGDYQVKVSFVGYKTLVKTLQISKNEVFNARLSTKSVDLQEVTVAGDYAEKRKKEESLNVEVVNDDYLKQNLGGSLMKSMERLPGVSTIDIGSGQSKPVIRGLSFNRVVVVEDGIKHEGQQWGSDHGLEIDQYAVDKVEVIKGPASLMYGSDAIGGIIDVQQNLVPAENSISGEVELTGKSNNDYLGASVSLSGRRKSLFASLRVTRIDYGDYKVPVDSVDIYSYRAPLYKNHLRNTAGKETDLHLSFGVKTNNFLSTFIISNFDSKSGFFANAHGLEPRRVDTDLHDRSDRDIQSPNQEVTHFKVMNKSQLNIDKFRLDVDLGFQRNFRQEWSKYTSHGYMPPVFPDTLDFSADLEREFEKYTYSGNVKATYQLTDRSHVVAGASGNYQDNRIDGVGFVIPAFKQYDIGGFLFFKHFLSEKSIFQAGVRYDYGHISTEYYQDWFPSPVVVGSDTIMKYLTRAEELDRNFSNISGSVGYNYSDEKWLVKVNLGRSFRMPIAKELGANGVNYHSFSYDVGDSDLSPEISWQLDVGAEVNLGDFVVGVSPFINYFSNYIYLNPTAEHDILYGAGNQIFNYTQSDVFRYGGELHLHYQIIPAIRFGILGEYVYSRQQSGEKKGFTLPFSPPASVIFNVRYQNSKAGFIRNPYCSVDYRLRSRQNKVVPPEKETDGSQVINLGAGGEFFLYKQKLNFSVQVQNLMNRKYFNHTSFYRLINVPEPGRNIVLNITVPF
jgi:iron complex outermembrane receptor protein